MSRPSASPCAEFLATPRRRFPCACLPSTRPTASRSGATISGPITCPLPPLPSASRRAGCRLHRHGHPPGAGRHHRSASHALALYRAGVVQPAQSLLSGPAKQHPRTRFWPFARAARRSRHRLPHDTRKRGRNSRGPVRAGIKALPYHAGLDGRHAHENQDAFNRDEVASSWPPSPSAWASTNPTSGSLSTPICPKTWRATIRKRAARPRRRARPLPAALRPGRHPENPLFHRPDDR